jgi:hypothetical protein
MNSVSQVNSMAEFMRAVSAARNRNSGLVSGLGHDATQAARSRSFQSVMKAKAGYTSTRAPMARANEAAPASTSRQPVRVLGTKFDAYA